MSILSSVTVQKDVPQDQDIDSGFIVESDVYPSTINNAYLQISAKEAVGVVLNFTTDAGKSLRQTLWVQSGKAKGKKNYYVDRKGEKQYLPAFIRANAMAQLIANKDLSALEEEEKTLSIYSAEAKKEVPTQVSTLPELANQKITFAILKFITDKTVLDVDDKYVPTGETREENEIDKVFEYNTGLTTTEKGAGKTQGVYIKSWHTKNAGKTKNKAKGAVPGTAGAMPPSIPGTPGKSLFDDA